MPWQKSYYHLSRELSMPCQYKSLTEVRPKGILLPYPNYSTMQSASLYHFDHYGYTHNRLDGTKKALGIAPQGQRRYASKPEWGMETDYIIARMPTERIPVVFFRSQKNPRPKPRVFCYNSMFTLLASTYPPMLT
jgi:hypothetical protein